MLIYKILLHILKPLELRQEVSMLIYQPNYAKS